MNQQQLITRRAWLEIDLDRMAQNLFAVRARLTPGCRPMAVVKADGYGQGAVMMAQRLEREGVDFFAVATLLEGKALRDAGIRGEILVLSYTDPSLTGMLLEYRLIQAVSSARYAAALDTAARAAGGRLMGHVKLDTVITRTGFDCETASDLDEIAGVYRMPGLAIGGIFSHFSSSDDGSEGADDYCLWQVERFGTALDGLTERGVLVGLRHLCNSGGVQKYPQAHFDLVRCGALLSGYPTACHAGSWPEIRPVTSLKASVVSLREIAPGTCVSYSRTFRAAAPMRVAVLSIGYADGYPRALSRKGRAMLHGRWANQLGNICMDQMMIDVTGIPDVRLGDAAVLIGEDGALSQNADEVAAQASSCVHELLSRLGPRLQRLYYEDGTLTAVR